MWFPLFRGGKGNAENVFLIENDGEKLVGFRNRLKSSSLKFD